MVGIGLIAGPEDSPHQFGGDCRCASLKTLTYPKLYIAGAMDTYAPLVQQLYDQAGSPKTLVLYPGTGNHATDLFYSDVRKEFLQQLLDFVNKL
jgi:hypothetical protein